MNRVTFEMLAKWIAQQNKAKIVFDGTAKGAYCNMKTNEIFMPTDLKEHNILAGLALLMHEAGHLNKSKTIPHDLVKGKISREILNVIEDVRVDNHNFQILYNIKEFYERLIKDHVYARKDEIAKEELMTRCLINAILRNTGFRGINDAEADEFNQKNNVESIISQGGQAIERKDWNHAKEIIKKVKKIFNVKDEDDKEEESTTVGIGEGGGTDQLNVQKYLHPASAWDKGEGIKGPSKDIIGEASFQELTKESFKELLNIKEKRIINEGLKLDTDNLTTFFTGCIDDLFTDEDKVKVKKSKIAFCLDASGSMGSSLIDGKQRTDTLVRTVRSIINILKEIQETEGLNISYDVWAFDYKAEKLNIDSWEKDYTTKGGGTNLLQAFLDVQDDILKNQEIDGNKMVILVTDGEVGNDEIEGLKGHIIKHGAEVKCMVIGIGANMSGHFVTKIAGDNNILAEEHADSIVMDCIRTMVE